MNARDRQHIEYILDYCDEIQQTVSRYGDSVDIFIKDKDYQKSISLSFLEIGEISKRLTENFREMTADHIPWRQVTGLRDEVAHGYRGLDFERIFSAVAKDIPSLKAFCEEVLANPQAFHLDSYCEE